MSPPGNDGCRYSEEQYHAAGTRPAGPLTGDPASPRWGGHSWSAWLTLGPGTALPPRTVRGLYRIRDARGSGLLYVGEGLISARLAAHWKKTRTPADPQGQVFKSAEFLECSWAVSDVWLPHQRLELECDLIGAHLLETATVPAAQFIG